jgi:hypothetical protein
MWFRERKAMDPRSRSTVKCSASQSEAGTVGLEAEK